MHEVSLAQGIVEIAEGQARAEGSARITRIRLEIGALAHVEPDAIVFAFEAVSRGTLAEGAVLEIDRPVGSGVCLGCGSAVVVTERGDGCPKCGGFDLRSTGGDELRVIELEVE